MEDKGVFTLQLAPSKDLEYKLFKLKIGEKFWNNKRRMALAPVF